MADVKACDQCGAIEDDRDVWLFWWYSVGVLDGGNEEACSVKCAEKLLRKMQKRNARIQADIEAEAAG